MEQQDQFQVEVILGERTIPRGDRLVTQYKVKWKGYSANESTWEPIENLENCLHLLEAYQEKLKKKSEPKPPKASGNPKKATARDKVNASREALPKESAVHSSNDFYFEDEDDNEAPNIVQSQPSKMEVQPAQEDAPQSASKEITKPKNKVKQVAAEESQVKVPNKRGRKKKKTEEVLNVGSIDELNITYEQLGERAAEEQLNYEPTKRIVKVNNETEERWNSFTQTEPIVDIKTDMEVITMHTSYEYPGKVWFTVREFGKLMEVTRQTLLETYPRVLYAYYHKHYLMAKQRSLDLMRENHQNSGPVHVNLLESNQESNSIEVSSESVSSEHSQDSEDYLYISEMQKKERVSHKQWKKERKEKLSGKKRKAVSEGSEEDQNDNVGE